MRPASAGGIATTARRAVTVEAVGVDDHTPVPLHDAPTGERSTTRAPSLCATQAISCEPPWKRNIWAPPRVLKLRSNVPGFCSSPEEAM